MTRVSRSVMALDKQLKTLSRNDWGDILVLLEKKTFQRKFQIIEAFTELVAERGFHRVTHADLARKCKTSRQLIDHHFPNEAVLISLTYRYIYAKFQKRGADGLLSKQGFLNQFKGYVDAVAGWVIEQHHDARFLVQFYALLQVHPEFAGSHDRNTRIGQERITALCLSAQKQGYFAGISHTVLSERASSVQMQMVGFVIMYSVQKGIALPSGAKEELLRCCLQILQGSPRLA